MTIENGVELKLRKLLVEVAGLAPDANSEADLYSDLGVPSIKAIQLLSELEDQFSISIPDDDFVQATSIARLTAMIERLSCEN